MALQQKKKKRVYVFTLQSAVIDWLKVQICLVLRHDVNFKRSQVPSSKLKFYF